MGYDNRHGLTRIDPVKSVLIENDGFDPKQLETHFLPWLTWFDPYEPGELDLIGNDGFDPKQLETHFLPWSTWFDPVDLVLMEICG